MATDETRNPEEQPAIITTIVGGRPPGCGQPVGEIPRGMEVLVKKAAVDNAFRELLLRKRAAAAKEIDLKLAPAEVMMLNAAPEKQLEKIIASTRVRPENRKAFLGKVAAIMLAALSMQTMGCDCDTVAPPTTGIRPDQRPPEVAPMAGERVEPADNNTSALPKPTTKGIRPDRPPEGTEPEAAPKPQPSEPVTRGIRPDRPRSAE